MSILRGTGVDRGTGATDHLEPIDHTGITRNGAAPPAPPFSDAVAATDALYAAGSEGEFFYCSDGDNNPANYYTDAGSTLVTTVDDLVYQLNGQRTAGTGYNMTQTVSGSRPFATNDGSTIWGMKGDATGDIIRNTSVPAAAQLSAPYVLAFSGYNSGLTKTNYEAIINLRSGTGNVVLGRDNHLGTLTGTPYGFYLSCGGLLTTSDAPPDGGRFYVYAVINGASSSVDVNGSITNGSLVNKDGHSEVNFLNNGGATAQNAIETHMERAVLIDLASADKSTILDFLTWGH